MYLQAKDLRKTYLLGETQVPALRGLNFAMSQGEFTAVMGTSGSGKTTLLNLIGCIDRPDTGEIWIDGENVNELNEDRLSDFRNQKIGFIFQTFNLVPVLNVIENVELPLIVNPKIPVSERHDRVMTAIKDVGLEQFLHHVPDQLSGGQRQRVAIARALVGSPSLILADEPTANLDSDTTARILDLMQELNERKKVTFLFSTHDEKLMRRAKRVVRIQDGQVSQ